MKPKTLALTGVALAALAVVYVTAVLEPGRGSEDSPERTEQQVLAATELDLANPEGKALTGVLGEPSPRSAVESAVQELEQAADPAGAGVGELRLSVVDADTGVHLDGVGLRAISEERLLDVEASSPITMGLTAGAYELLLLRPRYDHRLLAPFVVAPDQTVDLGSVAMSRGSGIIEGAVRVPAVRLEGNLSVELHGDGRNPCSACDGLGDVSRPCPLCGFGAEKSVLAAAPDVPFLFGSLAAGDYDLVVYTGETVLFTRRLSLQPGERRWLDAELSFVDVDLRLTGPEERPFTGEWYEDAELFSGPILFFFLREETCCGAARWEPSGPGLQSEVAYEGNAGARPSGRTKRAREPGRDELAPVDPPRQADVPRQSRDRLWPTMLTPPPQVQTRPLGTSLIPPSLFRIRRVPVSSTAVLVTCGPYFTKVDLSLDDWDGRAIDVKLSERCMMPSKGLQGMTACTSCHALPTGVFK